MFLAQILNHKLGSLEIEKQKKANMYIDRDVPVRAPYKNPPKEKPESSTREMYNILLLTLLVYLIVHPPNYKSRVTAHAQKPGNFRNTYTTSARFPAK